MCGVGGFASLFPMQELSVMGLVEILPFLWRFRRRLLDTLRDIETFQPDLVLTIDSKGFTFRVLKALQAKEAANNDIKRIKKAHYVAPSVWAYKHRGKRRNFTELQQLLDAMFTILPFEEEIFRSGQTKHTQPKMAKANDSLKKDEKPWCHFVGHPAVEDFLEFHGLFDEKQGLALSEGLLPCAPASAERPSFGRDALLDFAKYDRDELLARGELFQALAANGRDPNFFAQTREEMGFPADALVICALVGSRVNEVNKSSRLVLDAIDRFRRSGEFAPNRKSSDLAVAVSGTIVLETTLVGLPTVVIYRANRLTEWIAQRLAAVRFVSVPNLLLGRYTPQERSCRFLPIANTGSSLLTPMLQCRPRTQSDALQLSMALGTLIKWQKTESSQSMTAKRSMETAKPTRNGPRPTRASDLAAKHLFEVLDAE
ncbi:hypothetical protein BBJ28_00014248 [Nothophytophthora sp. Chile5]|nr:hypothetical protein BBJ28_00014248 [Nothophytophthora sp. Chile5]